MTTVRGNADLLLLPAIRSRLKAEGEFEGGSGVYWAVMVRADGLPRTEVSEVGVKPPVPDQVMFANDMVGALNRHLHHDGAWIVGFTNPHPTTVIDLFATYDRFFFLWIDEDADPGFTIECDSQFHEVLMAGPDLWMEKAERGWMQWHEQMRGSDVMDKKLRDRVTFKRAQGQEAPSSGRH